MREGHLDAVAAIEGAVQSFPWTRRNFADGLLAGYPAFVACDNGVVVGYHMTMLAPDIAHLLVLGVAPVYQKHGLGKALLNHCESTAVSQGLSSVLLEVRVSNSNAIGFYQHLGYKIIANRKEYYPAAASKREDAHVMSKDLIINI